VILDSGQSVICPPLASLVMSPRCLHDAAHDGSADEVRLFLEAGYDINRPDHDLRTPLHLACLAGRLPDVVAMLLSHPLINVNVADRWKASPFMLAACFGHVWVVQVLLQDDRVFFDQPDETGCTGFWWAAYHDRAAVVDAILGSGRPIHVEKRCGQPRETASQVAARRGHTEVSKLLATYTLARRSATSASQLSPHRIILKPVKPVKPLKPLKLLNLPKRSRPVVVCDPEKQVPDNATVMSEMEHSADDNECCGLSVRAWACLIGSIFIAIALIRYITCLLGDDSASCVFTTFLIFY